MVSLRLTRANTKLGMLALLLAVLVISLCLSQRMGLKVACAYQPAEHSVHAERVPLVGDASTDTVSGRKNTISNHKEPKAEPDQDSCSLSEQLLSKVFQHLDPLFIALILLFALWLAPNSASRYCRRRPATLLFSGRRRHLVLCVFRE